MITLSAIGAFFLNTKLGQCIAAVALLGVMFTTWLMQHDAKVRLAERHDISKQAEKQGAVAEKARLPAERPGSWDRLKRNSCRDCN